MIESVSASADLKLTARVIRPDIIRPDIIRPDIIRPDTFRIPPHSEECERGVLGCVLRDSARISECITRLKSGSEAFYDFRHQVIFNVMVGLSEEMKPIDLITVFQRLKDNQMLEKVGGIAYVSGLVDTTPSAANLSYYLDHVVEKSTLRKIIHTCTDIVGRVYEFEGDSGMFVDEVERDILAIREKSAQISPGIKSLVHSVINDIEDRHQRGGGIGGMSTGLPDLDYITDGLHDGELVLLSAFDAEKKDSSSVGKTSLALTIAEHVLLTLKQPVLIFSPEMTAGQLTQRLISSISKTNIRDIGRGFMAERDFPKITSAAGKLANSKLHIENASGMSILELRSLARMLCLKHDIKFILVDGIQLLSSPESRKSGNREEEASDITLGLFNLAKELNKPVMATSQTNDDGKLRNSKAARHHTDSHWQLRPRESRDDDDGHLVDLLVDKNRNGESGKSIPLVFLKCFTRFESAAKISDADVPNWR